MDKGKEDKRGLISFVLTQGLKRELSGAHAKVVSIGCFLLSCYQFWAALFGRLDPLIHRAIHMGFILFLAYTSYTVSKKKIENRIPFYDLILGLIGASVGAYYFFFREHILGRFPMADPLTLLDFLFGAAFIILTFEAVRRTLGPALAIVIALLSAYTFLGPYIPGTFNHRGLSISEFVDGMCYTVNGILGSPVAVSSTFVFLFVTFGAFLSESGGGDFFFDLSNAIAGKASGGAAKVAVIASALFGTISGSPTSDVVTTGTFTIPMMRRLGYKREFAGAVEAVASTGGSILPPVMGSAAFLMVEVAGIDYAKICAAAAFPGILYYIALAIMVHLEAKKLGLKGLPADQVPKVGEVLKKGFHFMIPLTVMIGFLIAGRSPSYVAITSIGAVVVVSWLRKESRMGPRRIYRAMVKGAMTGVIVSSACAGAGLVVGGIMSTGLGGKFTSLIMTIGEGHLFISLVLTMVVCIILGMGMPVAAAYMLTVVLTVPALLGLGVSLMSAHLFAVYFSVMSAITPPVAVAAYAASGFAEADPVKIGWQAVRLGVISFIVPYIFVYNPSLLLVGTSFLHIIFSILTAVIGVGALSVGMQGWFTGKISIIQRLFFLFGGLALIYPGVISSAFGAVIVLIVSAFHFFLRRKAPLTTN